jgi:ABC-type multidrug transport system fused ATPase/permease subunit
MPKNSSKISIFNKIIFLLTPHQKKQIFILGMMLFVGTIFEMAGLGILLPILGLLLTPDIGLKYPVLKPYLEFLGNPTQIQLVVGGMVVLVFIYLAKSIFLLFLIWRQSKFTSELAAELSHKLFKGYLNQPYSFHLQRNSAFLMRNIQSDITQFSNVSQAAITLSLEFSLLIGVAFLLIIAEPFGAMVVTGFLTVSAMFFQRLTKKKLLYWGKQKQSLSGLVNKSLQQGFGGVKDIKVLGRENQFLKEYDHHNVSLSRIMMRISTLNLVPRSYLEFLAVTGLAGLIVMMVLQGKSLELLIPTIGIFVAAAFRMIPSVNRIMSSTQTIRFSRPVIDMLYDEFHMIENNGSMKGESRSKIQLKEAIKIENLNFQYQDAPNRAVNHVSLEIKKGESIGLVGPSGSGKSTMVDLILGLLSPESGRILIDDKDVKDNLRNWQNQIGYVPQSIYLTDDTLRRNVAFGIPEEEIDNNAVDNAIKAAQLDSFIATLAEGLQTFVGERGVRLSGGQRQRIGIARALYHDPEILVLDEATSALDTDTEDKVMKSVNILKGSKTLILIAHRLSSLQQCDTIYQMEKGEIIQKGSAKDMLRFDIANYNS